MCTIHGCGKGKWTVVKVGNGNWTMVNGGYMDCNGLSCFVINLYRMVTIKFTILYKIGTK